MGFTLLILCVFEDYYFSPLYLHVLYEQLGSYYMNTRQSFCMQVTR